MKKTLATFLQGTIVVLGVGVFIFMLWEPHLEGRNAHATLFEVYFKDPFLAYIYMVSISFFIALYQAFKLLGFMGQNKTFSKDSVKALLVIKYCAISLVGFIILPVAFLFIVRPDDDIAGGVAMGLMIIFASVITATVAFVFEKRTLERIKN